MGGARALWGFPRCLLGRWRVLFFSKTSAAGTAARCSVPGMKEGRVCNDGTRHQLAFSQTKAVTAAGGGAHVVLLVVPHELERNGTERKQPWCVGGVCFQGTTKAKGRVLHAVLATCTP